MSLQARLARICGDAWKSWKLLAVWPWPAVCIGYPDSKFTWTDYNYFRHVLRPGDMLVMTSEKYFLSNRGISGTAFKHLAVYTGSVQGDLGEDDFIHSPKSLGLQHRDAIWYDPRVHGRTLTHAISDGVVCQDLGEVLFHEDYVAVVRPWKTAKEQMDIVSTALGQVGKEYNFDFTSAGPPALYCTELGEYCCIQAKIVPPPRIKLNVDWKGVLVPLDRYKAYASVADQFVLHFPLMAISKVVDNPAFVKTSAWAEDLRAKIRAMPVP